MSEDDESKKSMYDVMKEDGLSDEEIYDIVKKSMERDLECDEISDSERKYVEYILSFDGDIPGRLSVALDEMFVKAGHHHDDGSVSVEQDKSMEIADKHGVKHIIEGEMNKAIVSKFFDSLHFSSYT